MFKTSDILYNRARSSYFLVLKKYIFDVPSNTKGYILLDLLNGGHIHSTAPRTLYKKVA